MVPINGLHHFAYRCRDAEETRHFYEDILGLPLVHLVRADKVPSTGEDCPFVHIFFRMTDGSHIAFFDLGDNVKAEPSPNTPAWVNHLALAVADRDELRRAKDKLEAAGIPVLGVTDHHFIESIYFFDPNGIRLELTTDIGLTDYKAGKLASAHAELDAWTQEKRQRLGEAA
ncbi:Catechol 2,3-dioxygenase [Rhizobiales bacterium GAS191]|jgi:glyoxylase I family protein|nr:Catechol 2,3-dioxygenase [Rhizobiales bacterium GAS113]SEB87305.1 Catechol 2,3-dioxygenase [Rhizobiales bacterium GAS188]SED36990.1 Catechol 2,3-dioxygenase [Rhizobiales bacterium GAS191]